MKKRLLCAFLVSSMILGSCNVYADGGTADNSIDTYSLPNGYAPIVPSDETTSNQAILDNTSIQPMSDEETSGAAVSSGITAYAADTNYVEIPCTDDNGVNYTLTVKYDYIFNEQTCCQVTNISKDVICDVVIPAYVPVVIDGSTVSLPVRSIEESAFETAKCTSITLPETIREIKTKAFLNCTNVKTISINGKLMAQESVQQTDESGNIVYSDQLVSDNLTSKGTTIDTVIYNYAFQGCTALESVYISGFQTMKDYLFSGCTSLKSVTLSTEGMYKVNSNKVSANELTMVMGKNSFENCTALEEITIPTNLKTLGTETFKGCTALKTVNIGATLTGTLNIASFGGCTSMETVNVVEENVSFCSINGLLYKGRASAPSSLVYCPPENKVGLLEIPSTVTSIVASALYNHKYVTGLKIDSTKAVTIGANAFESCPNLTSVDLCATVVTIGANAFQDCVALTSLSHTYGFTTTGGTRLNGSTMGAYAFSGCNSLTSLTLTSWKEIGNYAFANCTGLTDVTAGEGVGTLGDHCFEGCTALKTVDLTILGYYVMPATYKPTFGTYIFKDCSSLETADLPNALLGISTGTFQNCVNLTTVTVGDNAGSIESLAFDNCPSLVNAPSPRFLVHIDANAFAGCTSLTDYEITRSALIIDDDAFVNCPNLVINAPDGSHAAEYAANKNIGYSLIADDIADEEFLITDGTRITGYRGGFESLTIPSDYFKSLNNTENIFGSANKAWIDNPLSGTDCSMKKYLKYIDLGPVTVISKSALAGSAIEEANLGNSKIIYNSALQNCTSLKNICIPGTVQAMGSSVFSGCTSLVEVEFAPPTVENSAIIFKAPIENKDISDYTTASNSIFSGCTALTKLVLSDNVNNIPESCFSGCTSLKEFISSYACKSISKSAFKNCSNLETIKFSPLTDRIGELAFENCTSIKNVTLQHNTFLEANVFKGCTNINRIIIPQTVNVAISNTPFVSTYDATVVCAKDSKGEEYAKAFNDPVAYSSSFMSEAVAKSFEGKYNYTIEYAEFIEGVDYVTIKGKLTIPEGVTVTRNGVQLTEKDYVIGGDLLIISVEKSAGESKYLYANGTEVESGSTYTVPENENVVITLITAPDLYGDVNYDEMITANDAAMVLQHALTPTFDEKTKKKADVNADSIISASDAAMILQKALDNTFVFPVEENK